MKTSVKQHEVKVELPEPGKLYAWKGGSEFYIVMAVNGAPMASLLGRCFCGVVLHSTTDGVDVGHHSNGFSAEEFKPWYGTITMEVSQ